MRSLTAEGVKSSSAAQLYVGREYERDEDDLQGSRNTTNDRWARRRKHYTGCRGSKLEQLGQYAEHTDVVVIDGFPEAMSLKIIGRSDTKLIAEEAMEKWHKFTVSAKETTHAQRYSGIVCAVTRKGLSQCTKHISKEKPLIKSNLKNANAIL
ncbi:uncharacterized protein CLUP02_02886 [Colletotrichum lupini]|uniref:Uncharacterized protein n=1 Tax=Colletotrichum lupini TaxID=145971 RepID=A0A9Q8SHW4_9PEZI|nr:uncharacterized protein CLUP02_02886 [Colletotrichum lupini]UQC77418.1 hypothetical protein CLUP02_02886 [Colletotrichum lupini]